MRSLYVLLIFFACSTAAPALDTFHVLTTEQWAVPRSVEAIIAMQPLARAIQEMQATPQSHLMIRYSGGDEGTLWVQELRSWLVSLGVSSKDIELIPGSANSKVIELDVVTTNEDQQEIDMSITNNNETAVMSGANQ